MKKQWICILYLMATLPLVAATVDKGDTREEVIEKLGEPTGTLELGSREVITYNGANIKLKDGKVYYIDRDFASKQVSGKERSAFNQAQHEKGLVQYQGKWIKKEELAAITARQRAQQQANKKSQAPQYADVKDIRDKGRNINLQSILVPGKVTIVDFYADWCGPCKKLDPVLSGFAKQDSDVVLRKIDIVKWGTPVTKQYNISSIPHVSVYDKQGKLVGSPTSNRNKIAKYIQQAKGQ